jgi:Cof subfamily protein (haloacid dehalogenase superfamily)
MEKHRGWIALDIDGTITNQAHHVAPKVVEYLHSLAKEGWSLMFITGRTFSFAHSLLHAFDFPYYLAVQNGADILYMPEKKLLQRYYMNAPIVKTVEKAYKGQEEDFIIYTGFEKGDFCYFRPERFSPPLRAHLDLISSLSPEPWKEVDNFEFGSEDHFPLIKCLGSEKEMKKVHAALAPSDELSVTLIRDPLGEELFLNLVTHRDATKGSALEHVMKQVGASGPVIAAGDDLNDVSMLKKADVKIVMESAPKEMHGMADILAISAQNLGIVDALTQGIARVS